jgi:hypothetical protein
MQFFASRIPYTQARAQSSEDECLLAEDKHEDASVTTATSNKRNQRWTAFLLTLCFVCTAVNVFLAVSQSKAPVAPLSPSQMTRNDIAHLRRPSQYIRFDDIERPFIIPRNFSNFPIFSAAIDSADAKKIFEIDIQRTMTHVGSVSFETKRVLVSGTVSLPYFD